MDEKVGIQKTGLKTLTEVVQKMKLDNTVKEETFGKAFEKLRKAVDGMKKKSNNMEKVTLLSSHLTLISRELKVPLKNGAN